MSVQQSFELIKKNISDSTEEHLDQFWVWIVAMRYNLIEKDDESGYYKLITSPDFVVSDFLITTRRIKEIESSLYTTDKKWVTTNFSPFSDPFDEAIEDTTPFALDKEGNMVEWSEQNSYRELGGFTIQLEID